ncbi:hypothetical protein [Actinotalea fermentans]|uniref:ABC3 transporter permease protein domain-containing protein n=1 Tax=Actinotalea fermentans TaxID=43671 RepID=A0A511YWD8_9CELL|nr:hypothetical protein [Actinotalea fermentans]GEN79533.1 hypothetical protein AFE02nite_12670 [Actinotalea fermentans]
MSGVVLVARRALTQVPLLAAVLAVLVAGSTLVGLCTLLLTTARDDALVAALRVAPAEDLRLTVAMRLTPHEGEPVLGTDPRDLDGPVAVATAAASEMLSPVGSSVSTWLTSPMLRLHVAGADGPDAQGYLLAADDVAEQARLADGRWPAGRTGDAWETALPQAAAEALGVGVGDVVGLGGAGLNGAGWDGLELADVGPLVVVGVFAPSGAGTGAWERDELGGAGYDGAWSAPGDAARTAPTSGPFVVDAAALGSAVPVHRASMWFTPDVSGATPQALAQTRANLGHVDRELTALLGGDATSVAAASRLSRTLARAQVQQDVTAAVVLVVAVVGFALAVAALGLAGRLLLVRRSGLAALLVARGARKAQLVGHAALEAVVLAVVGGAAAVPLAVVAYGLLARTPRMAGAGLDGVAAADGRLVVACAVAAAFLAVVLVLGWIRRGDQARRRTTRTRRGALLRSGLDVAGLALASAAYLQLRSHLLTGDGGGDPVLVAAPVVALVAGALVALRVVPLVERLAERHAARSRHLVLPLAEWQVARRAHSAGVAFLLLLATAAGTFGTAFSATWDTSQRDQVDARVGGDVTVLAAADRLPGGAEVAAASGGDPTPVSVLEIGLGADIAGRGPSATLVAFDTTRAGELLRGRLPDGQTWTALTSQMAPEPLDGVRLADLADGAVAVTASSDRADVGLEVMPSLVLEDAWGGRTVLRGQPIPLDGAEHRLAPVVDVADDAVALDALSVDGDLTLVAVELGLGLEGWPVGEDIAGMADVALTLRLPTDDAPGAAPWLVRMTDPRYPWFEEGSARLGRGTLDVSGRINLAGLWGDPAVVVSPFPSGAIAPLAVTQDVADSLGLEIGQSFSVDVGTVRLLGEVAHVVPYLPAARSGSAILVDDEALTRALLLGGVVESPADRWWVDVDDPAAAAAGLAAAGAGVPQTRDEVAAALDGPLRVGVPVALLVLVLAAVVLALMGTGLDTAAALEARAVEVARLQGLGISRRATLASLLAEHATVTAVVVLTGGVVGAVVARFVGPLLAVSETGEAPVPAARLVWPWTLEGGLLAALLLGSAAVAAPAAWALVRRAAASHLRVGDA